MAPPGRAGVVRASPSRCVILVRSAGSGGTAGKRHMESLKDRVAIVTGASRGIGLGIAAELVRQGARVCVTARKAEALEAAVAELGGPDVAIAVPGKADDADHQAEAVT